jgi:hypothetical protein
MRFKFDDFKFCPIRVITKLPNSEQSYKGKVKTHKNTNRQNKSTTGKLGKPQWPWLCTGLSTSRSTYVPYIVLRNFSYLWLRWCSWNIDSDEMGSWLLEKWIHHVCRRVFLIFFVDFKVKINERCIQLDSNVIIDLILVTLKARGQFTDTLGGGTVIPIIEDL